MTKGNDTPEDFQDLDTLTELTWKIFSDEADLTTGNWTIEDAKNKASARITNLKDGWKPNSQHETISLEPETEPYFNFESLSREDGAKEIELELGRFFEEVITNTENSKNLALRITMGSGKTTATVEKLKELFTRRPDLNVEYYVPRHDLATELKQQFDGFSDDIEIVTVQGRGHGFDDGNALCQRYEYVQSLEQAGISVRTNACRRNDEQRCDFIDECAYWRQFSKGSFYTGSLRIFPHAYLPMERDDRLPNADITIIDESFFLACHKARKIAEARLRLLINENLQRGLGDLIVDALRDGLPLLSELRSQEISSTTLDPSRLDQAMQLLPFEGTSARRPNRGQQSVTEVTTAKHIIQIIREEISLAERQCITRLRYDRNQLEVHSDHLELKHLSENTHTLILDATAQPIILEKLIENPEYRRIDINQRAYVTQVFDRTGSNNFWSNSNHVTDLILMLNEHAAIGENALCISHKVLADHLRDQGFPDNLKFEHFNNIRGIDAYKDFDTIFITGRNQPPQSSVDGIARALYWDDETPLTHDAAALLNARTEVDLPTEARGYLLTDPDSKYGIRVRSFSDRRIEAIHQQMREAETIQAIARLRLVHAERIKYVYLLGNLPIEMAVDELIEWDALAPNTAEKELIRRGNIPLTPKGWETMRPDIATTYDIAKNINKRNRLDEPQNLLLVSPLFSKLGCWLISFRSENGREQKHLFRSNFKADDTGTLAIGPVPFEEWRSYLENGDPEIENSGWGKISEFQYEWLIPDVVIEIDEE